MLLKDLTKIYIASKQVQLIESQSVVSYADLHTVMANVQDMSNKEEQRTYGIITNSVIVIRLPNPIQARIGDGVYFSEPEKTDGSYAEPDYIIESIKPAYTGTMNIRNPTVITARANNDKYSNQTQGQPE